MTRLFAILPLILLAGCTYQTPAPTVISFETIDRFTIFGAMYDQAGARPILLLHMLGSDRSAWKDFAASLNKDYAVLAIDLRGHGQSTIQNGVARPYTSFSDTDFQNLVRDVQAAKEYLKIKGYDTSKLAIIGASIGANAALNAAALDKEISSLVLLSPGLDYHSLQTEPAAYRYAGKALVTASSGDQYAADSSQTLAGIIKGSALKIYAGSKHGTELLADGIPRRSIVAWLQDN